MRCPNCGETLKDSARVCFMCGEKLPDSEVDQILDSMMEDDHKPEKKTNISTEVSKKTQVTRGKRNVKKSASNNKDKQSRGLFGLFSSKNTKKSKLENELVEKKELGLASQIISYITVVVILFLVISLNFTWFTFSGRGAFVGIEETEAGNYLSDDVIDGSMSVETIMALPETVNLFSFSANDLKDFAKPNEDYYLQAAASNGEIKQSIPVKIQYYYIKAIPFILYIGIFGILLLIVDRKLKTTEWSRAFSVLSLLIIGVNYLAIRIPFFSMIAIKAQTRLREADILNAVTMNLKGLKVNEEFYPYKVIENNGLFIAVICCIIWFVLATVLIEMKKDVES